jgi:polyisoprenoid-binding protein YceI
MKTDHSKKRRIAGAIVNDEIVSNRFREALKYKEYPEIQFNMYAYILEEDGKAEVKGKFSIAGVTRDVDLEAKLTPLPQNALSVAGNLEILMTDYGIKPREVFFGLIKVRDNISVNFDLSVEPSGEIPDRAAVSGYNFPRTEKSSTP